MEIDIARERLTLMAVHAHPDDEVFGTGGVFARAADEGMRTVLVVATGGEEGEIRDPARNTPEARARLAEIRAEELHRSAEILGIEEVHFLGYRDSGMLGTSANENPDNFLHADRDQAVRRVVGLIREIRPDVLVTYDERGGYGHPDHVTAHEVTTAAVEAAADPGRHPELGLPAWSVPKFYNSAAPRSLWHWIGEQMIERGITPEPAESDYDYESFLTPDEVITTRVDVTPYVARKHAALMAHESQTSMDDWLNRMPDDLMEALLRTESFIRVHSTLPVPNHEADLFAGLPWVGAKLRGPTGDDRQVDSS
jgi:N-acetyl-1-D-myo-inositol-2-amino-2-deoxy-alpha-D-glucopyranoside deacetylase